MDLEAQFHEAMIQLYHDIDDAGINYRPTRMLQQVQLYGGLATARRYLNDSNVTDGFVRLWEADRLDLTVEMLTLREPWRQLFTPEELAAAQHRLGV